MKTKIIKSVLFAVMLGFALVLTAVNANPQTVKQEAAKAGAKAARIMVVFNDAVRLTDSIQKVNYSDNHSTEEAFVKRHLEKAMKKAGFAIADEAGEDVVDVIFYIGIDDADDDNDGTADTTDTDDYGAATPESVEDGEIKTFDFDETNPADAKKLTNDKPNQGIYLLVQTGDSAMAFTMDEDVLGTGDIEGKEEAAAFQISSRPAFAFVPVKFATIAPRGRLSGRPLFFYTSSFLDAPMSPEAKKIIACLMKMPWCQK